MAASSEIFAEGLLAGRAALVTGGGTNLGKAAAAELVRCGAEVVIAGRREDVLAAAAEEVGCSWVSGDIREEDEARAIVAGALERCGRIDLLLNNAGGQYFVPAEGIAAKGWRAVMRLNVNGTLAMSRAAHELAFAPAGAGTILNVTVSPHHGMPAMAHTGAARAAVEAMTRELAREWDPVNVIALAIGRFDTESLRKYPEVVHQGAARSVPMQRLGRVEEYGWLVALMGVPGIARALSGTVVTLDGAADNWTGPWPPQEMVAESEGEVPTEARRGA
jgi:citronellol/citronellal dehydrogenase